MAQHIHKVHTHFQKLFLYFKRNCGIFRNKALEIETSTFLSEMRRGISGKLFFYVSRGETLTTNYWYKFWWFYTFKKMWDRMHNTSPPLFLEDIVWRSISYLFNEIGLLLISNNFRKVAKSSQPMLHTIYSMLSRFFLEFLHINFFWFS